MSNEVNSADILLYEDADTKEYVSVIFNEDNFWLSQLGMAELFGCTPENVLQHLGNIFEEKESFSSTSFSIKLNKTKRIGSYFSILFLLNIDGLVDRLLHVDVGPFLERVVWYSSSFLQKRFL